VERFVQIDLGVIGEERCVLRVEAGSHQLAPTPVANRLYLRLDALAIEDHRAGHDGTLPGPPVRPHPRRR
jgi:hypothetical protein